MSNTFAARLGRLIAGAAITGALVALGGGVAYADDAPSGTIQEVGGAVSDVEEATGVAEISDELGEATGLADLEDALGVTEAEEGLGLG